MTSALLSAAQVLQLPGFYEPFSSMSHLLGAALFFVLGVVLILRGRGQRARLISLGVYAFSAVLLMAMSGVYHMMTEGGPAREVMARLDHCAIFVLIAGTFTPTHIILLRGWRRWAPLAFIWTAAIVAITFKAIFFSGFSDWFGTGLYLLLGWFGALSGWLIARQYGWTMLRPLMWGAIAYTVGGVAELLQWPTFVPGVIESHEVFHIAVLAGALFHWQFIASFAGGAPEPSTDRARDGEPGGGPALAMSAR